MTTLGRLRRVLLASLAVMLLLGTSAPVRAEDPGTEHQSEQLSVALLSDVKALVPEATFRLGVRMRMKKAWHVYWKEPGDAGMAPSFEWSLPEGFEVGAASWPLPAWHKAEGIWTIVYKPEVLVVFDVRAPKTIPPVAELSVRVDWMVCHDAEGCLAGDAALSLRLPKAAGNTAAPSGDVALFDQHRTNAPRPMPKAWRLSSDRRYLHLAGEGPWTDAQAAFEFYPEHFLALDRGAALLHKRDKDGVTLRMPFTQTGDGYPQAFRGVLAVATGGTRTGYRIGWSRGEKPPSGTPLVTLAKLTETRPGNIAVTPQGRVIVTNQPLDGPALRAVEVLADGSTRPFPTPDWADGPDTGEVGLAGAIGITADSKGVVWLLDMGSNTVPARFVAWDTVNEKLHREVAIPAEVVTPISFLQDFALDEKRRQIYIADMTFPPSGTAARPAFIVLDLETGEARRVLEGASALMPVAHDIVIDGSLVGGLPVDGKSMPLRLGLNPIAIDPSFEWVYFGTVNGDDVFRLPASLLADPALERKALVAAIETYAKKRPSDGIVVDGKGRVFISDIEASAIGVATPEGYEVIAHDKQRLSWPDGFALGPDGALYITQNNLHTHPALNEGVDESVKPYHILKLKLDLDR